MGKKNSGVKEITAGTIIEDYLEENGFDGLSNEGENCACAFTSKYGDTTCEGPTKECKPFREPSTKKGKDIRAEKPKTS